MKKLTATITALALIASAASMLPAAAEDTKAANEAAYTEILESFREELKSGFQEEGIVGVNYRDDAGFGAVWGETEWELTEDNTGYGFFDIDGDGVDELFIGTINNEGRGDTIEEIYTRDDFEITHLAAAGSGHTFTLTTENQVYENTIEHPDGGVLYTVSLYSLDSGSLKLDERYSCDDVNYFTSIGIKDGEDVWEPIEQKEYIEKTSYMQNSVSLTPFSQLGKTDAPAQTDADDQELLSMKQEMAIYDTAVKRIYDRLNTPDGFPDDVKDYFGLKTGDPVEADPTEDVISMMWYQSQDAVSFHNAGLSYHDINNDGVTELLAGITRPDGSFEIFDVYTRKGKSLVHLASAGMNYDILLTNNGNLMLRDRMEESEGRIVYTFYNVTSDGLTVAGAWASEENHYRRMDDIQYTDGKLSCTWNDCEREEFLDAVLDAGFRNPYVTPFADYPYGDPSDAVDLTKVYALPLDYLYERLEFGFQKFAAHDAVSNNGVLFEGTEGMIDMFLGSGSGMSALWYEGAAEETLDNMGYAFADLDGDGTSELIVGRIGENGSATIYDIFGMYEGECVHLASSSARDRFSVSIRNLIMEDGSNGADSSLKILYLINNDKLEPAAGYMTENGSYYKCEASSLTANGYEFTWKEITKEHYDESVSMQTEQSFTLTPFREYLYQNTNTYQRFVYDNILEDAKEHVENGFANYADEDQGLYGVLSGNPSAYSYLWYRSTENCTTANAGYSLVDLNDDMRSELVIGTMDENGLGTVYDIYTCYAAEPYHIAAGGERLNFYRNTLNRLVARGSGSAASTVIYRYDLAYNDQGEGQLVILDAYERDADAYYKHTFAEDKTSTREEISESDYIDAYIRYATPQQMALTSFDNMSDAPSEKDSEEKIYAPVIGDIQEALAANREGKPIDQYDFSGLWFMPNDSANVGYAITDLDGNGTKELVLGAIDENGNGTIYDLFTIENGTVYHLASAGERDSFALTSRGQIVEQASGGADSSATIFYAIEGNGLNPVSGYKYEDGKNYKMTGYGEVGEQEFGIIWEETTETAEAFRYENIKMTPFADAVPAENTDLGDFNNDGLVNAADASEVLIASARIGAGEKDVLTESQTASGDTNKDDVVNAEDAANILQYAAYVGAGGEQTFEEYMFGQATETADDAALG